MNNDLALLSKPTAQRRVFSHAQAKVLVFYNIKQSLLECEMRRGSRMLVQVHKRFLAHNRVKTCIRNIPALHKLRLTVLSTCPAKPFG